MADLLTVEHLGVGISHAGGGVALVEDVSFTVRAGESYGIVGESGCGKSTTIRAIIRLLAGRARITEGVIRFEGEDLASADEARLRPLRGAGIGMIFQDPLTALNPVMTVGRQIAEGLRYHVSIPPSGRRERMLEVMRLVGLPTPRASRPLSRMSCQAASVSAPRSRSPSSALRACCWPMSRRRRST